MTEYAPIRLGEAPPIDPDFQTQGLIVGADPLLYQDGDTAYVETFLTASFESSSVSFRLPPGVSATPTSRVWISASRRAVDGTPRLNIDAVTDEFPYMGGIASFPSQVAGGDYEVATVEIDFSIRNQIPWPSPDQLMTPDTVFRVSNSAISGTSATLRTTWLRFIVEGTKPIPLRQYHRDDGLGVTPPRAFGGASRIRTGRAYGYD